MIGVGTQRVRMCDGVTRRELLRLGGIGAMGLTLPRLLQAQTQDHRRDAAATEASNSSGGGRATSCILFFLQGGQSQLETFDMKPDAPAMIRGEFNPIATNVPGLQICEHMPRLAQLADRYAIIRSMTHHLTNHNPGAYIALTGGNARADIVALPTSPDDLPNPGSVVALKRPAERPVPSFVQVSRSLVGDARLQCPGQNAGLLTARYDPFKIVQDPNDDAFNVEDLSLPRSLTDERFETRRSLMEAVDREFGRLADSDHLERLDTFYQRAFQLLTSSASRQAFDITQEDPLTRDRYGRNRYGQSLLLARRLVEAGVRLVTVYWGGALNAPDDYWDTHQGNFPKQRDYLLPQFDQCLSALLEDLETRGLLESTLIVSMGEFGRTPRMGQVTANGGTDETGRDHWPNCYSILLAGGGVRGGTVYGRSDRYTAYPAAHPVTPADLMATIYYAFGIDYHERIYDRFDRPHDMTPGGRAVEALFG